MSLEDGTQFAGFTIVRPLGAGGMGEVYLVHHPRLPRQEALKVLRADISANPGFRERFIREADLAAKLWHPHVVGIHDRGEVDGQLWISMDFVDGTDCGQLLRQRYPAGMPADQVSDIVTAVASALDEAHHKGLLHRDVKPSNVLLTSPDDTGTTRTLLTDFGIARNLDDTSGLTLTNMTVGTVAYSAPEQLMDHPIDGRADQYALAATAYHLLTGAQPFPNTNPTAVIGAHLTQPPPPVSALRPDLAPLDPIIGRALAKNPPDRFASCTQFAQALTERARGITADATHPAITRGGHLPPATHPQHGWLTLHGMHKRRRRLATALSALAVLVLIAVAATVATTKIISDNGAHRAARDHEAARMAGQHYLEALAAGDARTALSLSANPPTDTRLLTDDALRKQQAANPTVDIAVTNDNDPDPTKPADTERLVLSAQFGRTPSRTVMTARKIDGQWKLDSTTIKLAIGDPAAGNQSLKAVAIAGIPTNGVSPLPIFPGTPQVSSSNKYIDITADTRAILLEALTNPAAQPNIQPAATLNDAGRQAANEALVTRAHYCFNGGPPAPDCCQEGGCDRPPPPGKVDVAGIVPHTERLLGVQSFENMAYDLNPNQMVVHVTGTILFTAEAQGPPAPFKEAIYLDNDVDLTKDPPVYIHHKP